MRSPKNVYQSKCLPNVYQSKCLPINVYQIFTKNQNRSRHSWTVLFLAVDDSL